MWISPLSGEVPTTAVLQLPQLHVVGCHYHQVSFQSVLSSDCLSYMSFLYCSGCTLPHYSPLPFLKVLTAATRCDLQSCGLFPPPSSPFSSAVHPIVGPARHWHRFLFLMGSCSVWGSLHVIVSLICPCPTFLEPQTGIKNALQMLHISHASLLLYANFSHSWHMLLCSCTHATAVDMMIWF